MEEIRLEVTGMSCSHCENRVTKNIKELDGVKDVAASAANKEVKVVFDRTLVNIEAIKNAIIETGYQVK